MGVRRHRREEIAKKLRPVEVQVGQGMSRIDAIGQIGITEQNYDRRRKRYGGAGTDQLKS